MNGASWSDKVEAGKGKFKQFYGLQEKKKQTQFSDTQAVFDHSYAASEQ